MSDEPEEWYRLISEEPFDHEDHFQFFTEEQTEPGLVAKAAINLMDAVTTTLNRAIQWLEKS